jgi:hypothetical protein
VIITIRKGNSERFGLQMADLRTAVLLLVQLILRAAAEGDDNRRLLVFTVATERTEGYNRFLRSVELQGLELVTLGKPAVFLCKAVLKPNS